MATVVCPPASPKLKKVLRLHKEIENLEGQINSGKQLLRSLKSSGLGKTRRVQEIKEDILDFKQGIENLEARLKKLPALCGYCQGQQIIITGHMTDDFCSLCHGDGLDDGPLQKAHSKKMDKEFEKITSKLDQSWEKVPPGTIREPKI